MVNMDIIITEDGELHIQTRGFKGKTCLAEVEKLLAALAEQGVEVKTVDIKETEEMRQDVKQTSKTLEI